MSGPGTRDLLIELYRRGVTLRPTTAGTLCVEAPPGSLTAEMKDSLRDRKPDLLDLLRWEKWLTQAPLSVFERAHTMLEISVPGLPNTLWFASGSTEVDALLAQGVKRGHIWTACELQNLFNAPGITHEDVISTARAKTAFSALVVDVRPNQPVPAEITQNNAPKPEHQELDLGPAPQEFD